MLRPLILKYFIEVKERDEIFTQVIGAVKEEIKMNCKYLSNVRYADDTVLFVDSVVSTVHDLSS